MIWSLRVLRWSYSAFIAYASAVAVLNPGLAGHAGFAVRVLAGVEFAAALIFATGLFDVAASATLLALYAIVSVIALTHGDVPLRFVYYAATAVLIAQASRASPEPLYR